MWVNKKQHVRELDLLHRTIRDLQGRYDIAIQRISELNTDLRIHRRLAYAADKTAAAAKAYYDVSRLAVNELKLERAALLVRLLPGLELKVPAVHNGAIIEPPGTTFEDMGDAAASVFAAANVIPEDPDQRPDPMTRDTIVGQQIFTDPSELDARDVSGSAGVVVRSRPGA